MSDQEIKKDVGKNRLDLIPVECIDAIGKVLTFGAKKYSDHLWREGINYSRVYSAIQRHLNAFWGESADMDEESGLSHLSHAFCNIAFLLTYEANKEQYQVFDDRVGSDSEYYKKREEKIGLLLDLVQDNQKFFGCRWGDDKLKKILATLEYAIHAPSNFPDLTKMSHSEARKCLKPGMRVRVLRKSAYGERGWKAGWVIEMTQFIGKVQTIHSVKIDKNSGVTFVEDSLKWDFPAFVLEIVGEGK